MIDPRAIVDPGAQLGENVSVGPWSVVGPDVVLGDGCVVESHVVLKGPTTLGKNNRIFQFASVGEDTPDLKYRGEPTTLVMGDNNVVREGVTIHRGTVTGRSETRIGHGNLIMAYAHVGHDSVIGDNCILVNNSALAGHVHIGDWAILGGFTLVHQFCHIGSHCFTGMGSVIGKDVPAYIMVNGNPAAAKSINREGLRRRHFSREQIAAISTAYKVLYRQGLTTDEALAALAELAQSQDCIQLLIDSVRSASRGIVR